MSKILCKCGNVIDDITIPNPYGLLLISENDLDQLEGRADTNKWNCTTFIDHLTMAANQVYKCKKCGRLLVFERGMANFLSEYIPSEKNEPTGQP
ncbi:MAG: hypothetical protein LBV12_05515 [Puniceicoccales bacterium]|jgi:hypothetical protein|nr:hypothetical protein [Puniceicoccales bacterium]